MKKVTKAVALLAVLTLLAGFAGCAVQNSARQPETTDAQSFSEPTDTEAESETEKDNTIAAEKLQLSVAALKGPTGVGMVKLMQDAADGVTQNDYVFTVASAADEISGKLVSGEIDIASVPTNLAAKLYAKTGGKVRMLAVNTLGVLSVLSYDDTVTGIADLSGKTIYSTGEGSNPEYILRALAEAAGVTDLDIQFVATNDELVAKLISGQAQIALVPEPAATTVLAKAEGLQTAFSINEAWEQLEEGKLMMGCVIALDSFVDQNTAAVEVFLEEYKASIGYTLQDTQGAAQLCEKFEVIPLAAVAQKAIPGCNLVYVDGTEMRAQISGYFEKLLAYDPSSLGGALPGEEFYYHGEA